MTQGANTAFSELTNVGACCSGSVMVPGAWFPEAVDLAARNGAVDLGVHSILNSENKPDCWRADGQLSDDMDTVR